MSLKLERSNPPEWLLDYVHMHQSGLLRISYTKIFANFHSAGEGEAGLGVSVPVWSELSEKDEN